MGIISGVDLLVPRKAEQRTGIKQAREEYQISLEALSFCFASSIDRMWKKCKDIDVTWLLLAHSLYNLEIIKVSTMQDSKSLFLEQS